MTTPKRTGKASQPKAPKEKKEVVVSDRRPDLIYAKRGDQRNRFTQKEWEMLGKDKAGWEIDVEVPKEVQDLKDKQGENGGTGDEEKPPIE